jgi:hypothetical protein
VSKIFKEIDILIWGGLCIAVIGKLVYIPYRNELPKLGVPREYLDVNGTSQMYEEDHYDVLGMRK